MSGGKSQKFHVGYKYFLGVQKLLCHGPIDSIRGLWVEDKKLDGRVREPGPHSINKQELFGEQQGGISGTFDVVEGTLDQPVNTYLNSVIKDPLPAFRGVASLVLNRMYLGNNPYLKPWSISVSRIMKRIVNGETVDQWYKQKATIMGEADPDLAAELTVLKLPDGTTVFNTDALYADNTNIVVHWDIPNNRAYYWHGDDKLVYEFNINSMVVTKKYIMDMSQSEKIDSPEFWFLGVSGNGYFMFQEDAFGNYVKWHTFKLITTGSFPANITAIETTLGIDADGYFVISGSSYQTTTGLTPLNRLARSFSQHIAVTLPFGGGEMVMMAAANIPPTMVWITGGGGMPYAGWSSSISSSTLSGGPATGIVPIGNSFYMVDKTDIYSGFRIFKVTPTGTGSGPLFGTGSVPTSANEGLLKVYSEDYHAYALYKKQDSEGYYVIYQDRTDQSSRNTYVEEYDENDQLIKTITFPGLRLEDSSTGLGGNCRTTQSKSVFDGRFLYAVSGSGGNDSVLGYLDLDLEQFVPLGNIDDVDDTYLWPKVFVVDSESGSLWGASISGSEGKVYKWGGGGDAICPDMNPAHIIRECLTDQIWGLGYGDADVDDTSFTSAADQLFKEGFGLSLLWGRQTPIEDFVGVVLEHIDANVYVNRTTGKFVLKLIRDDYTTYPTFSDSDIIEVSDFAQRPESELINSLTVTYNDRKKRTSTSITVNDLAAIQQYGATIHTTVSYPGIYSHNLAAKVAARDLRSLSSPVYNGTIVVNRKTATDLNVGDVFDIDSTLYPELAGRVYRVGEINFGNSSRSNVSITFVEDVFSLGTAVAKNIGQIGTGSTLISQPKAPEYPAIFEADFYTYSRTLGDQTVSENLAYEDQRSAAILYADQVVSDALTFDVYSDISGSYARINGTNPSPALTLTEDLTADPDQTTVGVSFVYGEDLYDELTGNILAYVNSEIIQITGITSGTATIIRGIGDTVPAVHASGDVIRVFSQTSELDLSDLVNGDSVNYKIATRTFAGALTVEQSIEIPITFTGRIDKPWPVNNLSYNGSNYMAPFAGSANLTWANQDKYLLTGATPPDYLDASSGLETNTTNNVTVTSYNWAGSFLATEVSASTTSESYTIDTSTFNGNAFYAIAQVQVANTVNSKTNHQTASLTLTGGTKSNFNGILEWYDSTYFSTKFYEDSARTTLLSATADNVAIGAADDATGSAKYVYQDSVGVEPIFKAADGGTYTVPYMDFSTDKSFKYDSTVAETIYVYYMRPDGTFSSFSQSVIIGANTLNLSGEVFQFVISDQLTTVQRNIVKNIMSQGFDSLAGAWSDNSTWLDSQTWTE